MVSIVVSIRARRVRYADLRANGGPRRLTRSAVGMLEAVEWPGNVRDLEFAVWAAYEVARYTRADAVDVGHLQGLVTAVPRFDPGSPAEKKTEVVAWALTQRSGRVGEAAALLGVDRNTVRKWGRLRRQNEG